MKKKGIGKITRHFRFSCNKYTLFFLTIYWYSKYFRALILIEVSFRERNEIRMKNFISIFNNLQVTNRKIL